ncbi:pheromone-processing carboxypeptidase KEX1-like [Chenopodium quinoa]|uniref:pheromone-processing carboxypeptidase KEX1-like n=1 Tax=Chenopodium quinoa TaxID=63459 RepID=UPI000B79AC4F|nr:pheromone-processing carboxypeptidase KEX1-like [Chenopodium quinoa]
MGSTDSTATSEKVFSPPIWRPNERKSKKENVTSFLLYTIEMKMKMYMHLEFVEQGNSKVENKKEIGETSNKRIRGVERDGCGEWLVIIVDSDNDEGEINGKEGVGVEEKIEEDEEEDDSEEDEESDESTKSDVNSDSETKSEKEVVANLDVEIESSGESYNEDDDEDTGSDSSLGNNQEGNPETSKDSSMFHMKIFD